ncbi:MAG: hypothetical protein EOO10_08970 [Chitinophagaceae bacterium]|nr:MAG: hypothetical protein EOO10_08970 [Chitinophagaceae bacterium]
MGYFLTERCKYSSCIGTEKRLKDAENEEVIAEKIISAQFRCLSTTKQNALLTENFSLIVQLNFMLDECPFSNTILSYI